MIGISDQDHLHKTVFSLSPSESDSPEFLEGVDEIGKIVDRLAHKDEAEAKGSSGFIGRGPVEWRFEDERVRGVRILAKDQGVSRRWRLEDVAVRAGPLQEAGRAFVAPSDAADLSEDMAETTTKDGALVRGENEPLLRLKRQFEADDPERI